jgi:hypothetical protein
MPKSNLKSEVKHILASIRGRKMDFAQMSRSAKNQTRRKQLQNAIAATNAAEATLQALIETAQDYAACHAVERAEFEGSLRNVQARVEAIHNALLRSLAIEADPAKRERLASKIRESLRDMETRARDQATLTEIYESFASLQGVEQLLIPDLVALNAIVRQRRGPGMRDALVEGLETVADIAGGPAAAILLAVKRMARTKRTSAKAADDEAEYLDLYCRGLASWEKEVDSTRKRMHRLIDEWK